MKRQYSRNNEFELRKKYYSNGNLEMEGILYKGLFYGIYRTWHYNGMLKEFGIRYENKFIIEHKLCNSAGLCNDGNIETIQNIVMPNIFE
jgi:antitoxin component YwqK of YwqJK toxin-antitoxin module